MGWISTIGFIVGGVGIGAGLAMVVLGSSSSKAEKPHASIMPVVGPSSLGLVGTF
jgi:hypothetical protein